MRDLDKLKSKLEIIMEKTMLDTCRHTFGPSSLQKSIRRRKDLQSFWESFEYYCFASASEINTNNYQDI